MSGPGIALRTAVVTDCEQLWRWVNDPAVRASAFVTDPISLETHREWLAARLADSNTVVFIAENAAGHAVGQIRFDCQSTSCECEVDVTVAPEYRGQGIGARLIADGVAALQARRQVDLVRARVKQTNTASIAAFVRAGFVPIGHVTVQGAEAMMLVARVEANS